MAQSGKGALFPVKEKKSDKHPDMNGVINLKGQDYWLSAWKNTDKNGNEYLSVSIGGKREAREAQGDLPF